MRVGCFFKRIVVTPISDYYNLYEFLRVLAAFLAFYNDFPMPLLHTFRFTFACENRGMTGVGRNLVAMFYREIADISSRRKLSCDKGSRKD
ncbi:hypothetical protein C0Q70_02756 [Pomacea canaliculata]|uniref:Uncharacterized protein n=1 Tax=Pomacea canaliculata TaxID=400727 RepID=A0A2T7PQT4_POMCA|nr:hypothetical protein C0Q70_02756 [Pomacea canaliculata]